MAIKIIFDSSVLVSGQVSGNIHKTGLYRVSYEILKCLVNNKEFEIYLFDVFNRERELKKYVQIDFPQCKRVNTYSFLYRFLMFPLGNFTDYLREKQKSNNDHIVSLLAGILKNSLLFIEKAARKIERQFFINSNLNKWSYKSRIYFSTYYPVPVQFRKNPGIKKVCLIHDMIPIIHPEYFSSPYNNLLLKEITSGIEINDYIICVSESTKKDLLRYRQDLDYYHIIVSLLAASDNFYKVSDGRELIRIRNLYNIPKGKDYLLSVCTLEPRKNIRTVLTAFRTLLHDKKIKNIVLVLVGSEGWENTSLINDIKELNKQFSNSVIITGFVPDNDLASLYSGSFAFVYPSLYEGFGLPILEAMKCGVPVITSNRSSIPEVVGDCAIMIDPCSIEELSNAIYLLYNNEELRNRMRKMSLQRASEFNWSKVTDKIITAFQLSSKNND